MNNADMPAMPIPITANGRGAIDSMEYRKENGGITKLEHFAGLAMQGLTGTCTGSIGGGYEDEIAKASITLAKALLNQLEGESNE